jgi:uncharacterized protein YkwD
LLAVPVRPLARAVPAALAVAALVAPAAAGAHTSGHAVDSATRATKRCANTHVIPTRRNLSNVRRAILCLHNQIRARHHLPLLRINRKLVHAAAGHSASMVRQRYFDHTEPTGATFVQRIERARYVRPNQAWSLGENIAWGTGELASPAGVMRAWMHSPGHRANILHRSYREVGIGIKLGVPTDGHTGATFTIDFGARR